MKSYEPAYNTRCKPLLGTFVEISLLGGTQTTFDDAFSAIKKVSSLMSFHDEESDLSLLNRSPVGQWITLDDQIIEVLNLSLEIQNQTDGYFNVAIAQPLMFWKKLPGEVSSAGFKYLSAPGFEIRGVQARRILPIMIDLGGIAKGYAVDRAVEAIQKNSGEISGIVNAGGDLRVFGKIEHPIWIKDGTEVDSKMFFTELKVSSMATSSIAPATYVDPHRQRSLSANRTVVARSRHCVVADAFTKVALLLPFDRAQEIGAKFQVDLSLVS